jgi:hypothetical protein
MCLMSLTERVAGFVRRSFVNAARGIVSSRYGKESLGRVYLLRFLLWPRYPT